MTSLLAGSVKSQITLEPFPHLVIRNALPSAEYRRLSETYPEAQGLAENQRLNLKARAILGDLEVPGVA